VPVIPPGPVTPRSYLIPAVAAALILGIAMIGHASISQSGYGWRWSEVFKRLPHVGEQGFTLGPLGRAFVTTLWLSAAAAVGSLVIGVIAGGLAISREPGLRWLATGYVQLVRNTPLLVQLMIWWFIVAQIVPGGNAMPPEAWGVIALSVFAGAYVTEIVRGGIESVPNGQWEAGLATGFSRRGVMRYIVVPQAVRRILPALAGQLVSLVKDSSLLSTISVTEIYQESRIMQGSTLLVFEVFITIAFLYLAITLPLSFAAKSLERRWRVT
jgi:polar amino acid transport system permease protein